MTSLVSASQLSHLRLIFTRADKTGAGSLSASQVAAVLRIAMGGEQSTASATTTAKSTATIGGSSNGSTSSSKSGIIISDMMIQDLLSEVDVSADGGNGRCDFEEFVHLFSRRFDAPADSTTTGEGSAAAGGNGSSSSSSSLLSSSELTELKSAFRALDLDGDSFLSSSDLRSAFASIGDDYSDDEMRQMIKEMDSTGKGRIKLEDFLAAMSPA